jgi:hypothetical protein
VGKDKFVKETEHIEFASRLTSAELDLQIERGENLLAIAKDTEKRRKQVIKQIKKLDEKIDAEKKRRR